MIEIVTKSLATLALFWLLQFVTVKDRYDGDLWWVTPAVLTVLIISGLWERYA